MQTVVILLSDKRSGSTMFQDEFCRHPAVQTVPWTPHSNLETHWWLTAAVLLDLPDPLFAEGRPYQGYGGRRNARAYMVALLQTCVPAYTPPKEDRALVFEGWEALCRNLAQPVFFEKSPQILAHWAALSLLLEWASETAFRVRIVGLVRNPHGVMYSAARLFGTDPAGRQFAWLAGCRNLLAVEHLLPDGAFMRMRYEDLVADPEAGFAAIARFAGQEPDAAAGSGTHRDSSAKWAGDAEYALRLDPAVRQMAQSFGYSHQDLEIRLDGAESPAGGAGLRRRSLRLWLNRRRDRLVQPVYFRLRAALGRER